VFNFHGQDGTAEGQEQLSGLLPVSDAEQFLLVSPQGEGSPTGWTAIVQASTADDLQFFDDMVAALKSELCVNDNAVYATGFSMGGAFAVRLACLRGDVVGSVVTVAGIYYPATEECGTEPEPMLAIHGTADEVVPYGGGQVMQLGYPGVVNSVTEWGRQNGCDLTVATSEELSDGTRQAFGGCAAATELISMVDLGHKWPPTIGGEPTAQVAWDFMSDEQPAASAR
jgi:polyhydroxybutyrate depolymerase